jgi:branched-chain amino acid transport system permease protein
VILFMPEGLLGRLSGRRMGRAHGLGTPAKRAIATGIALPVGHRSPTRELLLDARGLRKAFRGVQALAGIDIGIRRSEILGLLGPNGSGKSTFINLVSGHFRPDAGEIRFDGNNLAVLEAHAIARSGIARTYQIPRPFAHLTVRENVATAAIFGSANLARAAAERDAQHWLEFTGLASFANALPDDLNLHQRKFLELARALSSRPRLLLLDEVLSGLTPTEIDEAVDLIRVIRDRGTTIVFVEHVMRAVMALTDRIVVLNHGHVIADGDAVEIMKSAEVVSAYLGNLGSHA